MLDFFAFVAAGTVLVLSAYLALVYMASKVFNRPELSAYARVELYQLFISAIIFVVAFGAFAFSQEAGKALVGDEPITVSLNYLQKIIQRGVLPAYMDLISLDVRLTYFSALEGRQGPGVWHFAVKSMPGLEPVISVVRTLTFTLTAIFGTLTAQVLIFNLIPVLTAGFMLPAGVLLRFFPPTRDAGVYLIVLAIAFQSFFPLLYSLNSMAMDDIWKAHGWGDEYQPYTSLPANLFGKEVSVLDPEAIPEWLNIPDAAQVAHPTFITEVLLFFPFLSFLNFVALEPFFEGIASLSLVALFQPALAMSVTVAFVNAVTKFITGRG